MRRMAVLVALGVLLAVMLSACGGEPAGQAPIATTGNEQVQAIAENMLAAYNLGTTRPSAGICRCRPS